MTSNQPRHTIALDAMGGDVAPSEPVKGAVLAAREYGLRVLLVGDAGAIQTELAKYDTTGLPLEVVPSEGVIVEGEHPVLAFRQKPSASVAVAAGLVKDGKADAFVTMGSTGAAMAVCVLTWGLFPGLNRPALGGNFIGLAPKTTIVDLGSQVDVKPAQLLNFATLGCSFAQHYLGVKEPRAGLLSVGSEAGKGNKQVQEAYALFEKSSLRFVGNVEAHEIFTDKADVIACDGFVGNVLLKYTEGLGLALEAYLTEALGPDSPVIEGLSGLASAAEQGGGPLFGVNGLVIIGHGRSKAENIAHSIFTASDIAAAGLIDAMRNDLSSALETVSAQVEN